MLLSYRDALVRPMIPPHMNPEPFRMTMVECDTCYSCEATNVQVYHRCYFPGFVGMFGWIYCEACKPTMENVVIPWVYQRDGDLPARCFRNVALGDKQTPFFFDRVSESAPEKNGRTKCTLLTTERSSLCMRKGELVALVRWHEAGKPFMKRVPLKSVLSVSKTRWPTLQSFLDEFQINVDEPDITPALYEAWLTRLRGMFAT